MDSANYKNELPKVYNVELWENNGFYVGMTLEEMKFLVARLYKLIDKVEFENYVEQVMSWGVEK